MDPRAISTRLHDILRPAQRARRNDPGRSGTARLEELDEVVSGLRALIQELGGQEPPRLPPRVQARASAIPEGRIAGTRATVQHRRRVRAAPLGLPALPAPRTPTIPGELVDLSAAARTRAAAEAWFRQPPSGSSADLDAAATA